MRMHLQKSTGRVFSVKISALATVRMLKEKIAEKHGIPESNQVLIFNGPAVLDMHILEHLAIKNETVLCLLDRCSYPIIISVVTADTIVNMFVSVEASDIPGDLKHRVERLAGIPARMQLLVFKNYIVHKAGTISYLGLTRGSILQVFQLCPAQEWIPAYQAC